LVGERVNVYTGARMRSSIKVKINEPHSPNVREGRNQDLSRKGGAQGLIPVSSPNTTAAKKKVS